MSYGHCTPLTGWSNLDFLHILQSVIALLRLDIPAFLIAMEGFRRHSWWIPSPIHHGEPQWQRSSITFWKNLCFLSQGAFYSFGNMSTYMTSYMRQNGSPNITYTGVGYTGMKFLKMIIFFKKKRWFSWKIVNIFRFCDCSIRLGDDTGVCDATVRISHYCHWREGGCSASSASSSSYYYHHHQGGRSVVSCNTESCVFCLPCHCLALRQVWSRGQSSSALAAPLPTSPSIRLDYLLSSLSSSWLPPCPYQQLIRFHS